MLIGRGPMARLSIGEPVALQMRAMSDVTVTWVGRIVTTLLQTAV